MTEFKTIWAHPIDWGKPKLPRQVKKAPSSAHHAKLNEAKYSAARAKKTMGRLSKSTVIEAFLSPLHPNACAKKLGITHGEVAAIRNFKTYSSITAFITLPRGIEQSRQESAIESISAGGVKRLGNKNAAKK